MQCKPHTAEPHACSICARWWAKSLRGPSSHQLWDRHPACYVHSADETQKSRTRAARKEGATAAELLFLSASPLPLRSIPPNTAEDSESTADWELFPVISLNYHYRYVNQTYFQGKTFHILHYFQAMVPSEYDFPPHEV